MTDLFETNMKNEDELIKLVLNGSIAPNFMLTNHHLELHVKQTAMHYNPNITLTLLQYSIDLAFFSLTSILIDSKNCYHNYKSFFKSTALSMLLDCEDGGKCKTQEEITLNYELIIKLMNTYSDINYEAKLDKRSLLLLATYIRNENIALCILEKSNGKCCLNCVDPENYYTILYHACENKWFNVLNKVIGLC